MEHTTQERLHELAQFLKTRRARLSPEQAGLPNIGRRRTPGLRRAEVAQLAGISVDWYTWLEQARNIQVSPQVLDCLARTLQLDANERNHLYLLASQQLPAERAYPESIISKALQSFLDQQGLSPAFIIDQRFNIVAWNQAAASIYGDYGTMSEQERNAIWRTFTSPYVRQLLRDTWENHARHRLASFRANYGKFAGDPWWMSQIEELQHASEEFRDWWPQHDVVTGPEGKKTNYHPTVGRLDFEQLSFLLSDAPHLTVFVNLPANADTMSKLQRLLADEACETLPNRSERRCDDARG